MDLLNQKILIKSEYINYYNFFTLDLPNPLLFGIPTLAFRVNVTTVSEEHNFIQKAILYLKNNGMDSKEISQALCLNDDLVEIILENNLKQQNSRNKNDDDNSTETLVTYDAFIFYNLLTGEFIRGAMLASDFYQYMTNLNANDFNNKNEIYRYRKDLGDSHYSEIHLINKEDLNFELGVIPSQEDILISVKSESSFDSFSYSNPKFTNEMYKLWLVVPFTVTHYNRSQYSACDPFSINDMTYSTYFYDLIVDYAKNERALKDISEFKIANDNSQIHRRNRQMSIRTSKEKAAEEALTQKYDNCNLYDGELQECMVKFEAAYDIIIKNFGTKNIDSNVRDFYRFGAKTLEELFKLTYDPYIANLPQKLSEDRFFERMGIEKNYESQRALLNKYFEQIHTDCNLDEIKNRASADKLSETIKKRNIRADHVTQYGICDLFTLNVINSYYFKDSLFNRIFEIDLEELKKCLIDIADKRNKVQHTFDKVDEFTINHEFLFKIIDSIFDVNNTKVVIKSSSDDEEFENILATYDDISYMPDILQTSCNQLLRDVYDMSSAYYSDCVIAFENISELIIRYANKKVDAMSIICQKLDQIPNNGNEAKFELIKKLDEIDVDAYIIENIKLDIRAAKNAIKNNMKMPASSAVIIAPLYLSLMDYSSFVSLFKELGSDYFSDAVNSIKLRGHSESTDWKKDVDDINERYVNYCRAVTLFYREEL